MNKKKSSTSKIYFLMKNVNQSFSSYMRQQMEYYYELWLYER